jgi:hypothetical protein
MMIASRQKNNLACQHELFIFRKRTKDQVNHGQDDELNSTFVFMKKNERHFQIRHERHS